MEKEILGDSGNNFFESTDDKEIFRLGGGNDGVIAGDGDSVFAGPGDDTIFLDAGEITADGGKGDDLFIFSATSFFARHALTGGPGKDTYSLRSAIGAEEEVSFTVSDFSTISDRIQIRDRDKVSFAAADVDGDGEMDDILINVYFAMPTLSGSGRHIIGFLNEDIARFRGDAQRVFIGRDGEKIDADLITEVVTASKTADTTSGTRKFDDISGDDQDNTILLGGGDDVADGKRGNDTLKGGRGNDFISGGSGNDTLRGDKGGDVLKAGAGRDDLRGGGGGDLLDGGTNNDKIFGNGGNDAAYGGNGNDRIVMGGGHDYASGGKGKDVIKGGSGNDILNGGAGRNTQSGGAGDDTFVISVGEGSRTIVTDFDLLTDTLQVEGAKRVAFNSTDRGADNVLDVVVKIKFGNGDFGKLVLLDNDLATFNSGTLSLQNGAGKPINPGRVKGLVDDSFTITGTNEGETVRGTEGDDTIDAKGGDDRVEAGGGNDTVLASTGRDTVFGGEGNDTLTGSPGEQQFLLGQDGNDTLILRDQNSGVGGAGNDEIIFTEVTSGVSAKAGDFDVFEDRMTLNSAITHVQLTDASFPGTSITRAVLYVENTPGPIIELGESDVGDATTRLSLWLFNETGGTPELF